ncbi:MAG: hypothetical protein L7F78_03985 [Syntrophales bacterium LBB04]|nr:hypothetical protein [Syntrophales bacterium LBB04]
MDPLTCPKCSGQMKVISVIEEEEVIKKILKHLGLWNVKARPPPRKESKVNEIAIDYSESQLLPSDDYLTQTWNLPMCNIQADLLLSARLIF